MKAKINKTNAVRLLDKAKIDYELIPYEVDENDLAAAHVAAQLGGEYRTGVQNISTAWGSGWLLCLCYSG